MADTNNGAIGDILIKVRGRHYLIPAEAIGAPLEAGDGGSSIIEMLKSEINQIDAANSGVEMAIELGGEEDRNARAITDERSARQCVRTARQCERSARQCVRQARQCERSARQCVRTARQCDRSARQCNRQAQSAEVAIAA